MSEMGFASIRAQLITPAATESFVQFDLTTQAQVLNYESLASGHIAPIGMEFIRTKGHKGKETLVSTVQVINSRLQKRTFLVTERATLADFSLFAAFAPVANFDASIFAAHANFVRWFNTIGARVKFTQLTHDRRFINFHSLTRSGLKNCHFLEFLAKLDGEISEWLKKHQNWALTSSMPSLLVTWKKS